jgi:hypothetical protein
MRSRASQRGENGEICPRPPVKGGPKICKRGAPKGVIKKFVYISNGMREIF